MAETAKKISMIPAKVQYDRNVKLSEKKMKVAAYCRVSTELEEQDSSYEAQVEYYTSKISENENWKNAGIYADDGKSGTNTKKRADFNAMIQDALAGKIDMILTKSVSRFARNTVDSLVTIRKLKEKNVAVVFEKEGINTLEGTGEILITILSSLAQEESRNISENIRWGVVRKFQKVPVQDFPPFSAAAFQNKFLQAQCRFFAHFLFCFRRHFHIPALFQKFPCPLQNSKPAIPVLSWKLRLFPPGFRIQEAFYLQFLRLVNIFSANDKFQSVFFQNHIYRKNFPTFRQFP